MSAGAERLKELEAEGIYVFHGSGFKLEQLDPSQAFQVLLSQNTPDGEPAIFASPFADYAIFMALINKETCPKGLRAGVSFNRGELSFRADAATLTQLNPNTTGYVYVFSKNLFIKRNESEWISYLSVKPIEIISVSRPDFTHDIREIEPSLILH